MGKGASNDVPLIVGISGIRGIVGKSLTPQVVCDFAACYGTPLSDKKVLVSRDGRRTGSMLRDATVAGLVSVGCQVVDLGIAATPTCGYNVKVTGAAGAIQITASHNPSQWNGLKLFRPEGFILSPEAGRQVARNYHDRKFSFVEHERVLAVETVADPLAPHLEKVLSLVDVAAIRQRGFHVMLDANHGSGALLGPRLLEMLGCRACVLGGEPDGCFEHIPEPTEANLVGLMGAVSSSGADLGFAVDPDADRLAIVDDRGRYIGEEYTLALAIRHRTATSKGPVVINGSTSLVSETTARAAGCSVTRTSVGEVHVAERMLEENALIGGEGNGGVIDPRVGFCRDSAVGMALVLELLATSRKPLSELLGEMPVYSIRKEKLTIDRSRLETIFERIVEHFAGGKVDNSDGVRVAWTDEWIGVRASNTEPIVRITAEACESARAQSLCTEVRKLISS